MAGKVLDPHRNRKLLLWHRNGRPLLAGKFWKFLFNPSNSLSSRLVSKR
jgi:hypothetical protein